MKYQILNTYLIFVALTCNSAQQEQSFRKTIIQYQLLTGLAATGAGATQLYLAYKYFQNESLHVEQNLNARDIAFRCTIWQLPPLLYAGIGYFIKRIAHTHSLTCTIRQNQVFSEAEIQTQAVQDVLQEGIRTSHEGHTLGNFIYACAGSVSSMLLTSINGRLPAAIVNTMIGSATVGYVPCHYIKKHLCTREDITINDINIP